MVIIRTGMTRLLMGVWVRNVVLKFSKGLGVFKKTVGYIVVFHDFYEIFSISEITTLSGL